TRDLSQMMQRHADVLGQEVAGDAGSQAGEDVIVGVVGFRKVDVMADVGEGVVFGFQVRHGVDNSCFQLLKTLAFFGGNAELFLPDGGGRKVGFISYPEQNLLVGNLVSQVFEEGVSLG